MVFGVYLALLVWCILFKFSLRPEEIPHLRGINLIPYAASVVVNGKVQISEIIENMLVFLPFGLCISAFYPDSEIQNRILLASGLSLFFEVTQYIFAIGASDITDVIDNTLGAVIGNSIVSGDEKNLEREDGKDHYHSGSGAGSAVSGVVVFYVCGEWDVLRLEFRKG
mgnify:CR=1 FL=1